MKTLIMNNCTFNNFSLEFFRMHEFFFPMLISRPVLKALVSVFQNDTFEILHDMEAIAQLDWLWSSKLSQLHNEKSISSSSSSVDVVELARAELDNHHPHLISSNSNSTSSSNPFMHGCDHRNNKLLDIHHHHLHGRTHRNHVTDAATSHDMHDFKLKPVER